MDGISKLRDEIENSPDGTSVFDANKVFKDLAYRTIVTIMFGEDVSQTLIEAWVPKYDSNEIDKVYKKVPLVEAILNPGILTAVR